MTSNRPYVIRALYEWILDNKMTPHLLVDTSVPGTVVPQTHVENNRIILNVEPAAVHNLVLGNERITFNARFAGKSQELSLPLRAVTAIYARETGKGLIFPGEDEDVPASSGPDASTGKKPAPGLKLIK